MAWWTPSSALVAGYPKVNERSMTYWGLRYPYPGSSWVCPAVISSTAIGNLALFAFLSYFAWVVGPRYLPAFLPLCSSSATYEIYFSLADSSNWCITNDFFIVSAPPCATSTILEFLNPGPLFWWPSTAFYTLILMNWFCIFISPIFLPLISCNLDINCFRPWISSSSVFYFSLWITYNFWLPTFF